MISNKDRNSIIKILQHQGMIPPMNKKDEDLINMLVDRGLIPSILTEEELLNNINTPSFIELCIIYTETVGILSDDALIKIIDTAYDHRESVNMGYAEFNNEFTDFITKYSDRLINMQDIIFTNIFTVSAWLDIIRRNPSFKLKSDILDRYFDIMMETVMYPAGYIYNVDNIDIFLKHKNDNYIYDNNTISAMIDYLDKDFPLELLDNSKYKLNRYTWSILSINNKIDDKFILDNISNLDLISVLSRVKSIKTETISAVVDGILDKIEKYDIVPHYRDVILDELVDTIKSNKVIAKTLGMSVEDILTFYIYK